MADSDIKHSGKASALMLSRGACKIALTTEVKTTAGFYKLTGYVRAINLRPGMWDRSVVVSFEAKGKDRFGAGVAGRLGAREVGRR